MVSIAGTVGVAAAATGAGVAASYDRRMFFMDNVMNFAIWAMGLFPKLIALKSHAEVRKFDREQCENMNKNMPIDKAAKKAHYSVEIVMVPVEGAEIEVKVFKPEQAAVGAALPLIIWYHGGGMCLSDQNDPFLSTQVPGGLGILEHFQGRVVIASVNYRLAPEHPFPTGHNDAIAAMRFLTANVERWGCDPACVCVAGMSAGAYLAAVVSQAARNAGIPLCAAVHIAPMMRRNVSTKSWVENGRKGALTSDIMLWFWQNYCPDPATAEDPRCEPVRGVGAGGLPPCLVLTNEFCGLRDEGFEYFEALCKAGVRAEHVRCRSSHIGAGFDKERWALALRWWTEALGLAEGRL